METLRFGLIGLGHFGKHYVRLLQEISGVELKAVANRSGDILKKTVSADDLLNNKEINCVIITTPPSTHAKLILKSLRAGKNVFVEKPMVMNLAEAKMVERELKKHSDLVFMVGFQYVYNDYIRYIKEHITELGKVKYVMGEHLYAGPLRADVGSFMDAAIHDCAVFQYLFSPGKVTKVSGMTRSIKKSKNDDFTSATITFQSGLMAHFLTSWYWPEKVRKVTLVGDKGMMLFNDRDEAKLRSIKNSYPAFDKNKSSLFLPGLTEQSSIISSIKAREPLQNELEHFIECVRTNTKPLTGIEFGIKVTAMMEKISKKITKG